jgi:hypothetical protein
MSVQQPTSSQIQIFSGTDQLKANQVFVEETGSAMLGSEGPRCGAAEKFRGYEHG